jgi:glycosyltransferase involved in cell wall biosynthesis
MEPISVVIITLNEEKNIGRCLESVFDLTDEIVVVDSFSTDKTREICKKYNVVFIQKEWEGYMQSKNFAMAQAKHDLILSLDADEVLSEELRQSLRSVLTNRPADGYTMNRLTNFCGKWIKHGGWYPDKKLRLIDRRKGKWTGSHLHERLVLNEGSVTAHLKGDLLHYSFHNISDHIRQIDKFSALRAKAYFESGVRVTWWHLFFKPGFSFFRTYILKAGFLDGYYGYIIAFSTAYAHFLRYAKLYELKKNNARKS